MAFKQPRVPQMKEGGQLPGFIRELVLFLKDFCMECWTESRRISEESAETKKKIGTLGGGVSTVNGVEPDDAGNVQLSASDVSALPIRGGVSTGKLKATVFALGNNTDYPNIQFEGKDSSKGISGTVQLNCVNRKFGFLVYAADQDGNDTRYATAYQLPLPDDDLTGAKYYDIFTSKNPPTPAQIGGVVGVYPMIVTSSSIAAGASGTTSVSFNAISGASAYYALLRSAGNVYGHITNTAISGTTLSVTFTNTSSAAHTVQASILIIGVK